MSESSPDFPLSEAVESAAAEWLVCHDRGLTPGQQDEFLQWLAASPAHRESFERHRRMWGDFDGLAQWRPEHSSTPNPDLLARARRTPWWRRAAPALMAAAALLLAAWWLPGAFQSAPEATDFEAAAYRQEKLPDGSVIDLNRGAHVVVQFSTAERRVLLVQGEAQFTVTKDPERPFFVRAGGVDVRAVGTAFNVKLAGANIEVLVTEGTVHVAQAASDLGRKSGSAATASPVVLAAISAGQRTVIPVGTAAIAAPVSATVVPASKQEIEQLLVWQPRLLDFDSTPLSEVVNEFNRRNSVRLVIGDDSLRTLPIVASIRSDNIEGFVHVLESSLGIRADRSSRSEIVLRRAR
jgi:transmembrane sensor